MTKQTLKQIAKQVEATNELMSSLSETKHSNTICITIYDNEYSDTLSTIIEGETFKDIERKLKETFATWFYEPILEAEIKGKSVDFKVFRPYWDTDTWEMKTEELNYNFRIEIMTLRSI